MGVFNNPRVANATALLSLVVALSSTAYAANTVRSKDIVNGQVKTKDLAKNAVKTDKIKDGTVTAADLAAGTAPRTPAYATYRDAEYEIPSSTLSSVLGLTLPSRGSYVVLGKVVLDNDTNGPREVTCRLVVGGSFDEGLVTLDSASEDDASVATFVVTATITAPATAQLQCRKNSDVDSISVEHRKIVAVKVDSLSNLAATGP